MAQDKWIAELKSVGFARQTDFVTENTTALDFHYFPAEVAEPEFVRSTEEFQAASGQIGANEPPVIGSKHGGKFSVKLPYQGFKSGYDPLTTEPGNAAGIISPAQILLGNALGSASESTAIVSAATFLLGEGLAYTDFAAGGYGASFASNAVVSTAIVGGKSTITVGVTKGGSYSVGQFVYFGADQTDAAPCMGWIESITADTITLGDTAGNLAVLNDESFAAASAFLSDNKPQPLTFHYMGAEAKQKFAFIGCVCTGGELTLEAGKTPFLTLNYTYTDKTAAGSGGALQAASGAFLRIQPVLGTNAGRLTYGTSGSGASVATGFRELKLSWETTFAFVPSHSSAQGMVEAIATKRDVKLMVKVPWNENDTITAGECAYEIDFVAGTAKKLTVYCGVAPGKVFSTHMPNVHHSAQPTIENIDGLLYWSLQFRPGRYTSEVQGGGSADVKLLNSLLRIGVI